MLLVLIFGVCCIMFLSLFPDNEEENNQSLDNKEVNNDE